MRAGAMRLRRDGESEQAWRSREAACPLDLTRRRRGRPLAGAPPRLTLKAPRRAAPRGLEVRSAAAAVVPPARVRRSYALVRAGGRRVPWDKLVG